MNEMQSNKIVILILIYFLNFVPYIGPLIRCKIAGVYDSAEVDYSNEGKDDDGKINKYFEWLSSLPVIIKDVAHNLHKYHGLQWNSMIDVFNTMITDSLLCFFFNIITTDSLLLVSIVPWKHTVIN